MSVAASLAGRSSSASCKARPRVSQKHRQRSRVPSMDPLPLSAFPGVASRQVECAAAGLSVHVLEAGYDASGERPLVLLLHGFPELAFSWRKVMPGLAAAGYYVVAPDCRGYGRTTGWDAAAYASVDLSSFSFTGLVRDAVALVHALGYTRVELVAGHDFGAVPASLCALARPDLFRSLITLSHPFAGPPAIPFNTVHHRAQRPRAPEPDIHAALAALPEPRKHYKWYNASPAAADDWLNPKNELPAFLRAYFHVKSAQWPGNAPHALPAWTAEPLASMPYYYAMPLDASMRDAVEVMPLVASTLSRSDDWLSAADADVYAAEFARTGFQGGLNWYRVAVTPALTRDLAVYAGATLAVPSLFIAGEKDWGPYQEPRALEKLAHAAGPAFRGVSWIPDAGHWVQQEKPDLVLDEILTFLESERPRPRGPDS